MYIQLHINLGVDNHLVLHRVQGQRGQCFICLDTQKDVMNVIFEFHLDIHLKK